MFLATCLAWLERRKRDHHMVRARRDERAVAGVRRQGATGENERRKFKTKQNKNKTNRPDDSMVSHEIFFQK